MTDPRLFERARALFERVCDLDGAARESALADSDPETAALVRELLAADAGPAKELEASPVAAYGARQAVQRLPERIGAFAIVERLGAGTTGVVYRARQDSPAREVALKVVRSAAASPDTLRRFANEAEVLARLDHPGIAKVFEAGTSDTGHGAEPWFALELVDGLPLNRFVRERALPTDAVVRLVADVAEAVHHAHQRRIVHRDLKPANVLVRADGRPKVLDFGLARTVADGASLDSMHTRTGDVLGTLAYMSPEQLLGGGAVDARSDVYALGVLAYEALSGALPLDVAGLPLPEVARVVQSVDPARLGTRARELGGDLETVVAKALAKERARRYATAADFAADLRRVLADEPVHARPPSAWYQATKFARRNRGFVTGLASVFGVLVAGVVVSTSLYFDKEYQRLAAVTARNVATAAENREREARVAAERASEREQAARQEAERAAELERVVFDRLLTLITVANPWSLGGDVLLADAIELAAQDARTAFPDQPLLRAEFLGAFARAYRSLGNHQEARSFANEALALATANGADPLRELELRLLAAGSRASCGESDAVEALREVYRAAETLDAPPVTRIRSACELAEQLVYRGTRDEGLAVSTRAVELAALLGPQDFELSYRAWKVHGDILVGLGRFDAAREALDRALQVARDHELEFQELVCQNSVANCQMQSGRTREARDTLAGVLERMRALGAEEHPFYLTQLANFGMVESRLGNYAAASACLREVIDIAHRTQPAPSRNEAIALSNLVENERRRGEFEEAARLADRCRPLLVAALGEENSIVWTADITLGKAYLEVGRFDDAVAHLARGLERLQRGQDEESFDLASDFMWYANALLAAGEYERALAAARRSVQRASAVAAPPAELTMFATQSLAMAAALVGDHDEALVQARAARADAHERWPTAWFAPRADAVLALCEALAGEGEPALVRFDEAFERMVAAGLDRGDPWAVRLLGLRAAAAARIR
jgi:tetratricopeptide (TPR) repeat protein